VFTAEITALLTALRFVGSGQPGEFLVLTDSLSSIEALHSRKISPRTHSVVYEFKEALWLLRANQFVVRLMWVHTHVGIDGNEMAKKSAVSGWRTGVCLVPADEVLPVDGLAEQMGWGIYEQVCLFNISQGPALSLVFGRGGGPSGDYGDFPLDLLITSEMRLT
jgi:hypothetical protein